MSSFVTPQQISLYKTFVNQIRIDLGRNCQLHLSGPKIRCPNCLWDPINHKSANVYSPKSPFPTNLTGYNGATIKTPFTGGICPWCNATGQVTSETVKTVKCLIRWLNTGEERYLIQGIMAENDIRLKADIKYKDDFLNARIVEVDGSSFQVKQIVPGGLRDLIQIKVFLKQSPWPGGKKQDIGRF